MSPRPEKTGYSTRTGELMVSAAQNYLGAVLNKVQNLKSLENKLRADLQPEDLQVVGLLLDPLDEEVIIERPLTASRGIIATAVHLVVKNPGIKDPSEGSETLYAIGRPFGERIDFYPLEGTPAFPTVRWGQSSCTYSRKYDLRTSSEPKRKKGRWFSPREAIFLSFDSPVPLGNLDLVEKIESAVSQNDQLLRVSDGIQAALESKGS